MLVPISSQAYIFLYTVLGGIIVGFVYDLFRVSRKVIKTKNIIVYLEDIIFWVIVSLIIFAVLFASNAGEIRGYALIGITLGVIIYAFMLSQYIVRILVKGINVIKNIFVYLYKVIMIPIKFLKKVLHYPIIIVYNIFKKIYLPLRNIKNRIIYKIKLNIKNIKISLKKF